MGPELVQSRSPSSTQSGTKPVDSPSGKLLERTLPSPNSCPPSPKPQIIKLVRSLSSMQLLAETGAGLREGKQTQHASISIPVTKPPTTVNHLQVSGYNMVLSSSPTPEAIQGLSQELEILEKSLHYPAQDDMELGHTLVSNLEPKTNSVRSSSSHSIRRISKEAAMARHLVRENTKLLKKLDRLEHELSQLQAKSKSGPEFSAPLTPLPLIEEDVPIAVATLKSKLTQSETTISQQRLQLEAQDARILELENKLNNLSDSLLVAQLTQAQIPSSDAFFSKRRSILVDSDDHTIKGFVCDLFNRDSASDHIPNTFSQALRSPVHISPTGEQLPLPIYSTGILKEPLSPIDMSTISAASLISTPTHSRNSSMNKISKSISISSLVKDHPSQFSHSRIKRHPTEQKVMEATVRGLETALQDSYQQHTSLHTAIHKLQSRLESSEYLLTKQKEAHKQALDSLMDQIERSKLEAASYHRQFSDVSRQNHTLNAQLEETLARLAAIEEKKPRFLCF